jgi:ParB/RepB/Spo0J family partition protein
MSIETLKKYAEILDKVELPTDSLEVADTNNRIDLPSLSDTDALVGSVQALGVLEYIVLNEEKKIVSGQLRWLAAKKLKIPKVPCLICRFKSKYHERLYSLLTDTTHHVLTSRDKYNFAKNCIEKDGKTVEQIACDVGVSPKTVRDWLSYGKVAEPVKEAVKEPSYKKEYSEYLNLGIKKKEAVDRILDQPTYKKNPDKAMEIVKAAPLLPLRTLVDMGKEAAKGIEIDVEAKKKTLEVQTILIHVRLPIELWDKFSEVLKKEHLDKDEVIVKLVKEFTEKYSVA